MKRVALTAILLGAAVWALLGRREHKELQERLPAVEGRLAPLQTIARNQEMWRKNLEKIVPRIAAYTPPDDPVLAAMGAGATRAEIEIEGRRRSLRASGAPAARALEFVERLRSAWPGARLSELAWTGGEWRARWSAEIVDAASDPPVEPLPSSALWPGNRALLDRLRQAEERARELERSIDPALLGSWNVVNRANALVAARAKAWDATERLRVLGAATRSVLQAGALTWGAERSIQLRGELAQGRSLDDLLAAVTRCFAADAPSLQGRSVSLTVSAPAKAKCFQSAPEPP